MARFYKEPKWKFYIRRLFQILIMMLTIIFIIITVGFISVEIEWQDGTKFKYKGWQINRRGTKTEFKE